ncbi:DnaJ-domain-containing protein [Lyophyllum atratum]|nr:DnaJ-domain-containing protein [Lyophyllum atratum]
MQSWTLYDILGIRPSASIEEVRKAYKQKALATHPDKLDQTASAEDKRQAENKFRKIREAFDVLGDSQKRKEYDLYLNATPKTTSNWSEELKRRMKERDEWARKQEEQHRMRMDALRERRGATGRRREQKEVPEEVKVIVDAINVAINEARPGWLDRVQKAQQLKAEWESKQARNGFNVQH